MKKKLLRVRFFANLDDCRPVNYPVEYPWWRSGETFTHSIVVSYADSEQYIYKNWPEATSLLSVEEVEKIVFTSRFPKLDWKSETIPWEEKP